MTHMDTLADRAWPTPSKCPPPTKSMLNAHPAHPARLSSTLFSASPPLRLSADPNLSFPPRRPARLSLFLCCSNSISIRKIIIIVVVLLLLLRLFINSSPMHAQPLQHTHTHTHTPPTKSMLHHLQTVVFPIPRRPASFSMNSSAAHQEYAQYPPGPPDPPRLTSEHMATVYC